MRQENNDGISSCAGKCKRQAHIHRDPVNGQKKLANVKSVEFQGANIEILPTERKIKDFGQLITVKTAVQVEFDCGIQCARAARGRR